MTVSRPAARRHALRARHAARRRPLRRVLTVLGLTFALLLVAGSATAVVAYLRLDGNIKNQQIDSLLGDDRPEKVVADPASEPLNILLMGSDKRVDDASNVEGERSDTTILLHLAADRQSATAVSIPRDTVVDIPACLRQDGQQLAPRPAQIFNSAFSEGGAACTVKTVEQITDVRIDSYVVIDFRGFKGMVNALGGVKVCIPYDVYDADSHLNLKAGTQTVKGQQALAYVRTRKGLGNGSDLSRIDRQQAFLSSMVSKVKSKGLLLAPLKLYKFLSAATKSITTDLGGLRDMTSLAQDLRGLETKNIEFVTAPNETYPADPNRVQLTAAAADLWDALRLDQAIPGKKAPSTSARPSVSPTGEPLVTAPEAVKVQVLDGTGDPTAAETVADALTEQGFQVVGTGTADRSDYTTTQVRHDPAYDESGRTLGTAIEGSTVVEDITLGATLVVVVGSDSPTVVPVEATGTPGGSGTSSPSATLQTRTADQDICS